MESIIFTIGGIEKLFGISRNNPSGTVFTRVGDFLCLGAE
ncbi:MAG: hypothetical protein QOF74_7795 [Caballeronia mineralivorans]|jgi:hypothetical protein|nr:hypothetical protein [Caballeronia mineralivorans]